MHNDLVPRHGVRGDAFFLSTERFTAGRNALLVGVETRDLRNGCTDRADLISVGTEGVEGKDYRHRFNNR